MRALYCITIAAAIGLTPATVLSQQAAGQAAIGGDLCKINRAKDQLPMIAGTPIQAGDVIKCIGRDTAKAFFGNVLVQFGPLSETEIENETPLTLTVAKGTVRATSQPGSAAPFVLQTKKSRLRSQGGDAVIRYNAASEFTEALNIDGSATAENAGYGAAGSVELGKLESTLLTPESAPTQPSPVQPRETKAYTRVLEFEAAPLPKGDLLLEADAILDEMGSRYDEIRRTIAKPTLPENAPFRLFDSRRQTYALPFFDVPGREAAQGGAQLEVEYNFEDPLLRP